MTRSISSSGPATLGNMGTGNFNIALANDQMVGPPDHGSSASTNLPGLEPGSSASFIGGDIVVVPQGSERVDDALAS